MHDPQQVELGGNCVLWQVAEQVLPPQLMDRSRQTWLELSQETTQTPLAEQFTFPSRQALEPPQTTVQAK